MSMVILPGMLAGHDLVFRVGLGVVILLASYVGLRLHHGLPVGPLF